MKGYYTKDEIIDACRGVSGLTEVIKRGDVWEHAYPPATKAKIHPLTPQDFLFEQTDWSDIKEGVEYTNIAGGHMKVIYIKDAPDYPLPRRW